MSTINIFSVIKNNIECALCKDKNCPLRYSPNHRQRVGCSIIVCKKETEKRLKKALRRKLP